MTSLGPRMEITLDKYGASHKRNSRLLISKVDFEQKILPYLNTNQKQMYDNNQKSFSVKVVDFGDPNFKLCMILEHGRVGYKLGEGNWCIFVSRKGLYEGQKIGLAFDTLTHNLQIIHT